MNNDHNDRVLKGFNVDELRRVADCLRVINPARAPNTDGTMRYIAAMGRAQLPDKPGYVETMGFCITAYTTHVAGELLYKVTLSSYGVAEYIAKVQERAPVTPAGSLHIRPSNEPSGEGNGWDDCAEEDATSWQVWTGGKEAGECIAAFDTRHEAETFCDPEGRFGAINPKRVTTEGNLNAAIDLVLELAEQNVCDDVDGAEAEAERQRDAIEMVRSRKKDLEP